MIFNFFILIYFSYCFWPCFMTNDVYNISGDWPNPEKWPANFTSLPANDKYPVGLIEPLSTKVPAVPEPLPPSLVPPVYGHSQGIELDIGWEFNDNSFEGWSNATSEVLSCATK